MVAGLLKDRSRRIVVEAIRSTLEDERRLIRESNARISRFNINSFRENLRNKIEKSGRLGMTRAVNATGVVLHTALSGLVFYHGVRHCRLF